MSRRRGGNERSPARLQVEALRRDVIGDELRERRGGGRPVAITAGTAVKTRARQTHVAEERAEHERIAALAAAGPAACFTAAPPLGPGLGFRRDDPVLGAGEQRLALGKRQSEILGPVDALRKRRDLLNLSGGAVAGRDLKQNLDAHDGPPDGGELSTTAGAESSDRSGAPQCR